MTHMQSIPAYKENGPVLYLRVNSFEEVAATSPQVDTLRDLFEGRKIFTVIAPFQEAYGYVLADRRFDEILEYPAENSTPSERSLRGLGNFLTNRGITSTIISIGSRKKTNYNKIVLAGLFCPGKRLFIGPDGTLTPLVSVFGLSRLFHAVCGLAAIAYTTVNEIITRRVERKLRTKIKYRRLSNEQVAGIHSILWIRLDHIGDVLMSLSALLALRKRFPDARIDILTQSTNRAILQNVVGIDNIIEYNAPGHQKNGDRPSSFKQVTAMLSHLLRNRYDMAVDSRGDDNARALALVSGAPIRIGMYPGTYYRNEVSLWGLAISHSGWMPELMHCSDNSTNLMREVGIEIEAIVKTLTIPEMLAAEGAAWLEKFEVVAPFAIVHMSSRDIHRNWLPERMVKVVDHLVGIHGMMVVLTGGPNDAETNEGVRLQTEIRSRVINAAGTLPLNVLPAIIDQARIMVTVDTGPMHIAAALAVPIVALFHKRTLRGQYPYGQRDHVIVAHEPEIEELMFDKAIAAHNEEFGAVQPLIYIEVPEVVGMIDKVMAEQQRSNAFSAATN
jgi:ADP-heptose:LPS heptosyltransferase